MLRAAGLVERNNPKHLKALVSSPKHDSKLLIFVFIIVGHSSSKTTGFRGTSEILKECLTLMKGIRVMFADLFAAIYLEIKYSQYAELCHHATIRAYSRGVFIQTSLF